MAGEYNTKKENVKKGVNGVLFGGSIAAWKERNGVSMAARSEGMERIQKEVKRARVLVAEREKKRSPGARGMKDCALLSRAVGREEEWVMQRVQARVEREGWRVGTMIHDAIIVTRHKGGDDKAKLVATVQAALEEATAERGWATGLIRAKVTAT